MPDLLKALPDAHCRVFYTTDTTDSIEPTAVRGHIDRAAIAELGLPTNASSYLCGPVGLMAAMTAFLIELGMAADPIHTELFASLLELAEACDVPTRWSCRTGVCHTCVTPLLSGAISYSPSPLTYPESGQVLLCCSRPDTDVILEL